MKEFVEFLEMLIAAEALVIAATVLPLLAGGMLYATFALCRETEKENKGKAEEEEEK